MPAAEIVMKLLRQRGSVCGKRNGVDEKLAYAQLYQICKAKVYANSFLQNKSKKSPEKSRLFKNESTYGSFSAGDRT